MWLMCRIATAIAGLLTIALLLLAFTRLPGRAYAWFAEDEYKLTKEPDAIVVLGGGGIPSKSGLMRSYLAAEAGQRHQQANVVLSLPADEHAAPGESHVEKMKAELVLRGIASERIKLETDSFNTHQQAVALYQHFTRDGNHPNVLLVTSDYHLKRSLLTFRRAGFERIAGLPAIATEVEADFGPLVRIRYTFWGNLQAYVVMARELTAMGVYKVKGWI